MSRRPIDVAVVQPSLAGYRVPFFAEAAARAGLDLTVHHGDLGRRSVAAEGFAARRVSMRVTRLLGEPWYTKPAQLRLAGGGCDVLVMTWDAHDLTLVPALLRARRCGVGTVLWGHGTSGRDGSAAGRVKRGLARLADALLLYTAADADAYRAAGLPAFAAPNAVAAPNIPPPQPQTGRDTLRLLFASRLVEARRVDVLLRAVRQVERVTLTVVGDGPTRAGLERLAETLGVGSRVTFAGAVYDPATLTALHAAADVYVHPSFLGLSAMTAMGHGLPVVTGDDDARHGPESRAVVDGEVGLRFRHDDADALADVLRRLRDDEPLRHRLAKNAYRLAHEELTIPKMADGFEAAVRHAAAR